MLGEWVGGWVGNSRSCCKWGGVFVPVGGGRVIFLSSVQQNVQQQTDALVRTRTSSEQDGIAEKT